jgi:HEAT repeat protein
LIDLLSDPDPGVRGAVVFALGESKDARAIQPLLILNVPDYDSNHARIEALSNLGSVAIQPLLAAMHNPDTRDTAADALIKMGYPAVKSVGSLLSDPDVKLEQLAADMLGQIKSSRAVDPLINALQSSDEGVRNEAADSLGLIGDKRAVEPLLALLDGPSESPRADAAQALGNIADSRAVSPLIAALKDRQPDVRRAAAQALGKIDDPQAIATLGQALRDKNWEIVCAANSFYIRRGEAGSEDTLIEALNQAGGQEMAEVFLNSGNQKLEDAAHQWASKNNYEVSFFQGGRSASWGSR